MPHLGGGWEESRGGTSRRRGGEGQVWPTRKFASRRSWHPRKFGNSVAGGLLSEEGFCAS